jgi:hypothetical protein
MVILLTAQGYEAIRDPALAQQQAPLLYYFHMSMNNEPHRQYSELAQHYSHVSRPVFPPMNAQQAAYATS